MNKTLQTADFDSISLKVASPEVIREWSYGEVTKPETINYRTGKSERSGLFDERIFGPEKDYECACGKYKRIRYQGIICDKCGVEVTKAIVRRERMGHIELASPVAHIWFLKNIPSRIALVLGMQAGQVEKVVYFAGYIVTEVDQREKDALLKSLDNEYKQKAHSTTDDKILEKLKELLVNSKREIDELVPWNVIDELTYHRYSLKYGACFKAEIGAEAIHNIFKKVDLPELAKKVEGMLEKVSSVDRERMEKRLSIIRAMVVSGIRPEWMFMTVIPVIPPGIRPMVALEGGRHATSDVNDLYRRVINRNNRLKKLIEIGAPEVILRNEKRILQEAVDSLFDNTARNEQGAAMSLTQKRQLKSLSDNLKGKQGLFRQNLLGKRVDYSARSVIVVGPQLKLDQCGLPKHMALELFKPFVISKILARELAFNIRGSNKLIEERTPEVWAILEEVIKGKYVLLNRAPTLHRLGIQAFKPILIEGNAISLHPLVCSAFNADFDGDQMAVHLPLSEEAQTEARELMAANKNILKPGSGDATISEKLLDIVLGAYVMTKIVEGGRGEGKIFPSPNAAITAQDFGEVDYCSRIKVLPTESVKYAQFEGKVFETTVGRLLFNSVLPEDYPYMNSELKKKSMTPIVERLVDVYGIEEVSNIMDRIKNFGFKYVTKAGITWSIDEVQVAKEKPALVAEGHARVEEVQNQFNDGLLSEEERYEKTVEVWNDIISRLKKAVPENMKAHSPVDDMIKSEARGSIGQLAQMAGMKGLIINNTGRTIDYPVIPSYKEGLSPIDYFVTTHGARKGASDTALNTAKAGYLTRRLVDVAQDIVVSEEDCGTKDNLVIHRKTASGIEVPLTKNIFGRVLAQDIEIAGVVVFKKGHLLTKTDGYKIDEAGIESVAVRSPLTCKTLHGVCKKCYGQDLGRNKMIELGETIGIVAAQAIGEPGTQLTMRTFHAGGVAGVDITQGLPRVEEIFEGRTPKNPALISQYDGEITSIKENGREKIITVILDEHESRGKNKGREMEYVVPFRRIPLVKTGAKVKKGQLLTDGSADIHDLFQYAGREVAQEYIVNEVNKVYELQGAPVNRKHLEVIIRQMFGRKKIKIAGNTSFTQGEVVENFIFATENIRVREEGGEEAKGESVVLGITEASLSTQSWLSSASFQNTTRVLINAAVRGTVDVLRGLKENVIIGRLIPAGTSFKDTNTKSIK